MSCRFLLDTNVISELNKPRPNEFVTEKMTQHTDQVATASVVVHELLYGMLRLPAGSSKRQFLLDYLAKLSGEDALKGGA